MPLSPLPAVLDDLRAGKLVILVDDEDRENEGDLVLPAQFATQESIAFMLAKALGYLCLCLPEADCDRLQLVPQSTTNTSVRGTAFTVSIDLHPTYGGTTGVSAHERARCIQLAIDPKTRPADFVRPGHVNPLRSRDGGVLVRAGQTEGSVDLCRLAGLTPAAVIIEVMRPDGEMARMPDLEVFAREHNLKLCSVAQLIEHRLARESLVRRVGEPRPLRTPEGEFLAHVFESTVDALPHLALTLNLAGATQKPTLVRMHRRHLLGDVFGALGSASDVGSTRDVLRSSLAMIAREGSGALVYLRPSHVRHDGIDPRAQADLEGLLQSFRPEASASQRDRSGVRPGGMDLREYGVGGQILRELGLSRLRLITTSTADLPGLDAFGLEIVERVRPSP